MDIQFASHILSDRTTFDGVKSSNYTCLSDRPCAFGCAAAYSVDQPLLNSHHLPSALKLFVKSIMSLSWLQPLPRHRALRGALHKTRFIPVEILSEIFVLVSHFPGDKRWNWRVLIALWIVRPVERTGPHVSAVYTCWVNRWKPTSPTRVGKPPNKC